MLMLDSKHLINIIKVMNNNTLKKNKPKIVVMTAPTVHQPRELPLTIFPFTFSWSIYQLWVHSFIFYALPAPRDNQEKWLFHIKITLRIPPHLLQKVELTLPLLKCGLRLVTGFKELWTMKLSDSSKYTLRSLLPQAIVLCASYSLLLIFLD